MRESGPDQNPLSCPICGDALRQEGGAFRCAAGHSYDRSREGYVNLLPPQHGRGVTGDLPEMLRARRRFLEAGYFRPLRDHLTTLVSDHLDQAITHPTTQAAGRVPAIAEIGCGEGYYIGGLGEAIRDRFMPPPHLYGMDISRPAVRLAARRYPEVQFFVGDVNRRIYLADSALDVLLNIFAPRNPMEFKRVLAPTGRAVTVIPAPDHLASLRAEFGLISIQPEKEEHLQDRFEGHLTLMGREELRYPLTLRLEAVQDLVEMGPSQWHLEPGWQVPEDRADLETETAFIILVWQHIV